MMGRDLQRARKTAARQREDAFVALKMRNVELERLMHRMLASNNMSKGWKDEILAALQQK